MKIKSIYAENIGPLGAKWSADFTDSWTNQTNEYILLSGPNGSGKSILLQMMANMWEAAGYWLDHLRPLEKLLRHSLTNWTAGGGFAIILESLLPDSPKQVGIFFGEPLFYDNLKKQYPLAVWVGEIKQDIDKPGNTLIFPQGSAWFNKWIESRKKLILFAEQGKSPNMVHLDAEDRQWVPPLQNLGDLAADNFRNYWLARHEPSQNWNGSLESTLINLKILDEKRFEATIQDLNAFLIKKEISTTIFPEDRNRLRVRLKNSNDWHFFDHLSAGERQVLILLFTVSRWMQPGGVVLVDEPDLFLHPSLIQSVVARLETMVHNRNGQLIITSHMPSLWERYELIGKRIALGGVENNE